MGSNILVIDDDYTIREMIRNSLADCDYNLDTAEGVEEGIRLLKEKDYEVVITDKNMPGAFQSVEGGMEILEHVKKNYPYIEVLVITGHASIESALTAMKKGAFDYIMKPFKINDLKTKIEKVIDYQGFIDPETTMPIYKSIQQKMIAFIDQLSVLTEKDKQILLSKINEINDYFFRSLKSRERVIIEQREALTNIAGFIQQAIESEESSGETKDFLEKIAHESAKRL